MSDMSSYLRDKVLDHVLKGSAFTQPANVYGSLHSADPGLNGASELSGGAYARVSLNAAFGTVASGGSKATDADASFPQASADWFAGADIGWFGLWDAASGGNFLYGDAVTTALKVLSGQTAKFPSGDITVTQA